MHLKVILAFFNATTTSVRDEWTAFLLPKEFKENSNACVWCDSAHCVLIDKADIRRWSGGAQQANCQSHWEATEVNPEHFLQALQK